MPEKTRQNIDQAPAACQRAAWQFGTLWCELMHDSPMGPMHSEYECRICGRRYAVPWAGDRLLSASAKLVAAEPARIRRAGAPSIRPASLQLIIALLFLLVLQVQAADEPIVDSTGQAAMAFARYTASLERQNPWS